MLHAHLLEIRNLQLPVKKTWLIKVLILCPKCSKTPLRASVIRRNFPGVIPPHPRERRGEGRGRKGRGAERRESRGKGLRHGCWGIDAPVSLRFL